MMDSELGIDINDEVIDNSTQMELDLVNNGTMVESFADGVCSTDETTQNSSKQDPSVVEINEPYVGQEFDSEEAGSAFYSAYGMRMGFITRMHDLSRAKDGSITSRSVVCNREGYRRPHRGDRKKLRLRAPTRMGCKAMLSFKRLKTGKWVVTKFVKEHSHVLACDSGVASINICTRTEAFVSPEENSKIQELTKQLVAERKRSASFKRIIDLLFTHIEDHTHDLSKRVQFVVDKVKEIESGGEKDRP